MSTTTDGDNPNSRVHTAVLPSLDATFKRPHVDRDAEEEITQLHTMKGVDKLSEIIRNGIGVMLSVLGIEKISDRREEIRKALNGARLALTRMTSGYKVEIVAHIATRQSFTTLEKIARLFGDSSMQAGDTPDSVTDVSVASRRVACHPGAECALSSRVSMVNEKSFLISKSDRIIIGHTTGAKDTYTSSDATEEAVRKCINPSELGLQVRRYFSAFQRNPLPGFRDAATLPRDSFLVGESPAISPQSTCHSAYLNTTPAETTSPHACWPWFWHLVSPPIWRVISCIDPWMVLNTKRGSTLDLVVPWASTTAFQVSFRVRAAQLWNEIPHAVRSLFNTPCFRDRLESCLIKTRL